jgi:hypothetical protein
MDDICNTILESVDPSKSSHPSLVVVAMAIQKSLVEPGKWHVQAIQLQTSNHNIIFKVCKFKHCVLLDCQIIGIDITDRVIVTITTSFESSPDKQIGYKTWSWSQTKLIRHCYFI